MLNDIDPKYWGKHFWISLNSIALTYDSKNKDDYYTFFKSLQHVLPCSKCKLNYKNHFKNINLDNSDTLLEWLINMRNDIYVDQKRNKKQTKESTMNEIFKPCYNYFILWIIIIILFCFIIFK